jgi:hypothetical protein
MSLVMSSKNAGPHLFTDTLEGMDITGPEAIKNPKLMSIDKPLLFEAFGYYSVATYRLSRTKLMDCRTLSQERCSSNRRIAHNTIKCALPECRKDSQRDSGAGVALIALIGSV